jgi:DNA helicase HerA-like ATPase
MVRRDDFEGTGRMTQPDRIFIGGGGRDYAEAQHLLLKYANRHGMITGATGTGKTVTLQILAESFSARGVPVFLADVKGDLSGLAKSGSPEFKLHDAFMKRAGTIGFEDYGYDAFPVTFWDVFGAQGHPVRSTVAEMGPLLISRLLELSDAQEGVLNIAFRIADEEGLPLLDLKDLQAMLVWVGQNAKDISLRYGNVSTSSVGAIQRALLVLEDLMTTTQGGQGRINVLAADRLMAAPRLYATFLLWLLSELFENLPEVGDPDKPKLVFFFDEAHLLFDDAPKALVDKVEQVARLIRSKGVSVFFITQSPDDVPEDILGQMGNRVQHALRAFTPRDQKALRAAAETFRPNPAFDTADAIRDVGVGEALVSTLVNKGEPSMVERVLIRPPSSQLGPITGPEREAVMAASPVAGLYDTPVDRQSAYEALAKRAEDAARAAEQDDAAPERQPIESREFNSARRYSGNSVNYSRKNTTKSRSSRRDTTSEAFMKSMARSAGTKAGNALVRGILGGLFKGL